MFFFSLGFFNFHIEVLHEEKQLNDSFLLRMLEIFFIVLFLHVIGFTIKEKFVVTTTVSKI
jgi:hypothetical protein